MKHRPGLSVLAIALTLLCAEAAFSQVAPAKPDAAAATPAMTDRQVADRLYKILEQELEKENICLSFHVGIALYGVITTGTAALRGDNAAKLPEAEANFRIFAQALIKSAQERSKSSDVKITLEDIRGVLSSSEEKINKWRICPLFPICK